MLWFAFFSAHCVCMVVCLSLFVVCAGLLFVVDVSESIEAKIIIGFDSLLR